MTTNICVYGKNTETNIVHRNSENLGKKIKRKDWNAKKNDRILKYVKCQLEEMIHIKKGKNIQS